MGVFNFIITLSPEIWLITSFKYSPLYPIIKSSPSYSPIISSFALELDSGSSVWIKKESFEILKPTWCVDLFEKIETLLIAPKTLFLSTFNFFVLPVGITLS